MAAVIMGPVVAMAPVLPTEILPPPLSLMPVIVRAGKPALVFTRLMSPLVVLARRGRYAGPGTVRGAMQCMMHACSCAPVE